MTTQPASNDSLQSQSGDLRQNAHPYPLENGPSHSGSTDHVESTIELDFDGLASEEPFSSD